MIEPRARLDAPFQSFEASIKIPRGMDGATAALVVAFAEALAEKLHKADNKYGYGDLWAREDWRRRCQGQLIKHLKKGDSRDVAAYCAFLWYHKQPTVRSTRATNVAPQASPSVAPADSESGSAAGPAGAAPSSTAPLELGKAWGLRNGSRFPDEHAAEIYAEGYKAAQKPQLRGCHE